MAKLENRYANALLEMSIENNSLENDLEQAIFLRNSLDDVEIMAFLMHPHIDNVQKYELFSTNFPEKLSDHMKGFLQLLVRKNRETLIIPALNEFIDNANRSLGIIEAKIVSAKELTDKQWESIRMIINKQTNKEISFRNIVDPDVIGGFYILLDGQVFDATIRTEINKIKEHLKRGGLYAS